MTSEKIDICFLMATMCTIPFIPKLLLLYSFENGTKLSFHPLQPYYRSITSPS